ncbi:hypothetical protein F5B18DRAFT_644496 [Nemania serpens]|nr:hypothetical protein F5B18DRAFT_644496 [Nemania serpens]
MYSFWLSKSWGRSYVRRAPTVEWRFDQWFEKKGKKKHTTPGIRWSSPTQLLIWRYLA